MAGLRHRHDRTGARRRAARTAALCVGTWLGVGAGLAAPAGALMISEVLFNPVTFGSDDGQEFVELYNDGGTTILLDDYSLGWGGGDYTWGTLDLDGAGALQPGEYFVIGGPADPLGFDFDPDLQDGFITADGLALFDVDAASIPGTTPVDALIYGTVIALNFDDLIDETGAVGAVDVTIGGAGESAARDATGSWTATPTPSPGSGPLSIPEPGTVVLVGAGLGLLAAVRPATHRLPR